MLFGQIIRNTQKNKFFAYGNTPVISTPHTYHHAYTPCLPKDQISQHSNFLPPVCYTAIQRGSARASCYLMSIEILIKCNKRPIRTSIDKEPPSKSEYILKFLYEQYNLPFYHMPI